MKKQAIKMIEKNLCDTLCSVQCASVVCTHVRCRWIVQHCCWRSNRRISLKETAHFISPSCQSVQLLLSLPTKSINKMCAKKNDIDNTSIILHWYKYKIVSNIPFSNRIESDSIEIYIVQHTLYYTCTTQSWESRFCRCWYTLRHSTLYCIVLSVCVRVCVCVLNFIHKNLDAICSATTTTSYKILFTLFSTVDYMYIQCIYMATVNRHRVKHISTHIHKRSAHMWRNVHRLVEKMTEKRSERKKKNIIKWSTTNAFSYEERSKKKKKYWYVLLGDASLFLKEDFYARWWLFMWICCAKMLRKASSVFSWQEEKDASVCTLYCIVYDVRTRSNASMLSSSMVHWFFPVCSLMWANSTEVKMV